MYWLRLGIAVGVSVVLAEIAPEIAGGLVVLLLIGVLVFQYDKYAALLRKV